ncbi:CUE domain containing protein [Acanthamoeba castellanii str. Neff]|uniref:CUE domain containing protein n=1 Tax=Acanthamoeba castellanii (strain ATCC 30010 / Neff) TaxID=1257118 RepID=L8H9M5_ACACF|nr:CUE domain containing protein [Acanthamoeba castellanii str. Neff]ELR22214.1 CUE domain containing protein [Acanthamoeba castellanii str. Neff]
MDQKPASKTVQLNLHQAILAQARQKAEQQNRANNNSQIKKRQGKKNGGGDRGHVVNVGQLISSISEMFPSLDKSVVELLLHEHAFQVEATIAQLTDMIRIQEDHQTSVQQQQQDLINAHLHQAPAQSDEELAQRLAFEMEQEERARREAQEKADEAMARALTGDGSSGSGAANSYANAAAKCDSAAAARTKKGGAVAGRSESGKWKVKQPPHHGDAAGAGAGGGGRVGGGGDVDGAAGDGGGGVMDHTGEEQWEVVGLSKKARKRRNKKTAAAATAQQPPATTNEQQQKKATTTMAPPLAQKQPTRKGSDSSGRVHKPAAGAAVAAATQPSEADRAAGLAFMKSIVPSFEDGLLGLLYEEHEWDLERTIEALLTLTNVNSEIAPSAVSADVSAESSGEQSPKSSSSASSSTSVSDEEQDEQPSEAAADECDTTAGEDWERIDEIIARMVREGEKACCSSAAADGEITFVQDDDDDNYDVEDNGACDELVDSLEVLRRRYLGDDEDDENAKEQAEHHDDDGNNAARAVSEKPGSAFTSNLDMLADMFPEYDRQALAVTLEANADDIEATTEEILAQAFDAARGNRRGGRGRQQILGPRKMTDEVLAKMGVAAKVQAPPAQAYYPNLPLTAPPSAQAASKASAGPNRSAADLSHVDLSTKLKLLSLRQQFWFVEAELLQAVFQQCGCNAGRTIRALTEIDPTMTWQSGKANDAQQSSAVDNNVNATAKQAGAQAAQKEPGRPAAQRQKRAEGRRERRKQEKFTLVTRKRCNTGNKAGSRASDGQDLRQQALDHASLRD